MMRTFFLALVLCALPSMVMAQDRVLLSEIVPALEGSALGAVDLGAAPAAGTSRTIRRAEILAAISSAGRSSEGLVIPRQARIERRAVVLSADEIERRAREAIVAAVAPCAVTSLVVSTTATIGEGELHVTANGPARPNDGATVVMLDLSTGSLATHVPARVDLSCPDPVVHSGSHVSVVVRVGAVRAHASGVVRGEGRVGDVVHVRVDETGALLEGHVLDAGTVEITP